MHRFHEGDPMTQAPRTLRHLAGATLLLGAMAAAHAATSESPTTRSNGTGAPILKGAGRQFWQVSDYTTIQLVPRESGGADNQHPWKVDSDVLRRELESVEFMRDGVAKPLLSPSEVSDLLPT